MSEIERNIEKKISKFVGMKKNREMKKKKCVYHRNKRKKRHVSAGRNGIDIFLLFNHIKPNKMKIVILSAFLLTLSSYADDSHTHTRPLCSRKSIWNTADIKFTVIAMFLKRNEMKIFHGVQNMQSNDDVKERKCR